MFTSLARVAKAATAALATASSTTVVAAQDGQVTAAEWLTIGIATVAAALATWRIPNAAPAPKPGQE